MVTEITNSTNKDVSFSVSNIATLLGEKGHTPREMVVKANSVAYSRSVTGDDHLESYLKSNGCTLKRVRRSYVVIVMGQSNAVGYDESPYKPSDVKPIPFAYYDQLYPTTRSKYGNAEQVPIRAPYVDCYQNMRNVTNSAGTIVKGPHRYIAEKLIGFVPEDYELEIWGYAYGGSGVKTGNAGTVSGANLPQNSTLWNSNGALSIATGKRIDLHFKSIQPESKIMALVWCLGEFDGQANVSVKDYEAGFEATRSKIKSLMTNIKDSHYLNSAYKIDTKEADGKKNPLWIVYPGPQKYWNTRGTFKQIIAWQKENFSNFVDLPENLQTNGSNPSGHKNKSWREWAGYGFTSSAVESHYANCYDFIGHKVAKQILDNYTEVKIETKKVEPTPVVPTPTPTPTDESKAGLKGATDRVSYISEVSIEVVAPQKETWTFELVKDDSKDTQLKVSNSNISGVQHTNSKSGANAKNFEVVEKPYNFITNDDGYLIVEYNTNKSSHLFKNGTLMKASKITITEKKEAEVPTPDTPKNDKLFEQETFDNVKFKLTKTKDQTAEYGDVEFTINGTGKPNRSVSPSGYYWDGSSTSPLTLMNKPYNFIIKDGYVKLVADGKEYFMYTSRNKAENRKLQADEIIKL